MPPPPCSGAGRGAGATRCCSTCRTWPRRCSRCWPARASVRCTPSCSAALPRTTWRCASTTRRPGRGLHRWRLRARARWCRTSPCWTGRWRWQVAAGLGGGVRPRPGPRSSPWPAATWTTRPCASATVARACRWSGWNRPSRATSSIPPAPPGGPRACSAIRAAMPWRWRLPWSTSSTGSRATPFSAPATSAGWWDTPISSTAR